MATRILSWISDVLKRTFKYFSREPELESEREPDLEPVQEPGEVSLHTNGSSSFPQFGRLPVELQLMIWEAALESDEVGICIPKLHPQYRSQVRNLLRGISRDSSKATRYQNFIDAMIEPLVVNLKLSPIFHVCGQSRYVARRKVSHKEDEIGSCYGASRACDPAKDIFFVTDRFFTPFTCILTFWSISREIRHIGFEFPPDSPGFRDLMGFWRHLVTKLGNPKVSVMKSRPGDLDSALSSQIFQIRELFTVDRESIGSLFRGWFTISHPPGTSLDDFLPISRDQLEVTVWELRRVGSEPVGAGHHLLGS